VKGKNLLISVVAAGVVALPAAPAAANGAGDVKQSCVGWFASTNAQGQGIGSFISIQARESRPFGYTTVSPFAHLELEDCQG
jgi:hypothetical protein